MIFKKRIKLFGRQRGFTLLESMVTLVIFILITVYFVVDFKTSNTKNQLMFARDQIVNDIKTMQAYAQAYRVCTISDNPTVCATRQSFPYGLRIDGNDSCDTVPCDYKLFVDHCPDEDDCPGSNDEKYNATAVDETLNNGVKKILGVDKVEVETSVNFLDFIPAQDITFIFYPRVSRMVISGDDSINKAKIILWQGDDFFEIVVDKNSGSVIQKGVNEEA